jgi:glycosyltransferase involved in cell wall biosynthesis
MLKILILTPHLPYPPQQGASLRNYHIIRGLSQRHDITLLSLVEPNQSADSSAIAPLLDLCNQIESVPQPQRTLRRRILQTLTDRRPDLAHRLRSTAFQDKLTRLLREIRFDVVQVGGLELAFAIQTIRTVRPKCNLVYDALNVETELQRRAFFTDLGNPRRWLAAGYSGLQIGRLRRFERWACQQADWVTAVSEIDRSSLLALLAVRQSNISVIPNCIDVQQIGTALEASRDISPESTRKCDQPHAFDIVFVGKMDYRPNVDAMLWFAEDIWPLIRARKPDASWAIVGQKPHPRLNRLRGMHGITLTGRVESVLPYLSRVGVYIMPFRMGSGTRLKLIEAMAAGLAIVSTPIGAEGFPVNHDKELLLARSATETAAAVLHLLDQPEERRRIGQAARKFAESYDWRTVVPRFDEVYRQLPRK